VWVNRPVNSEAWKRGGMKFIEGHSDFRRVRVSNDRNALFIWCAVLSSPEWRIKAYSSSSIH
jgi:hypothetical protein